MTFSTLVTLVMLAIFSVMTWMAGDFPEDARFMPYVVGIPGIVLCLIQLGLDIRAARRPRARAPSLPGEGDEDWGGGTARAELMSWGVFLGVVAGVLLFGFYLAAPIVVTLYLWRAAGVRLWRALIAGAAMVLALEFVFVEILGFRLFGGFATEAVLDRLER